MFAWQHNEIIAPGKNIQEESISNRKSTLIHLECNRHNIQQKKIREIWNETIELLEKETNEGGLGIKRGIFAYSRPSDLKILLQREKKYTKTRTKKDQPF